MDTGDIFLCQECGLPIRNPSAAIATNYECFLCPSCDVCETGSLSDIPGVTADLLDLLVWVLRQLYRLKNSGKPLPANFGPNVRRHLEHQSNPAEETIKRIREEFKKVKSEDAWLRVVAESEKTLAGFFYFSGPRRAMVKSQTVLRHWVALTKIMALSVQEGANTDTVLQKFTRPTRYNLNLVRLSKLIGDNPVRIIRDPNHYLNRPGTNSRETRADHLKGHLDPLMAQTAKMNPKITDLQSLLRFAGNACFITDPDEVIEFRNKSNRHLIKYLLKDRILIVVDDLWFVGSKTACSPAEIPPAELVTIFPEDLAKDQVIHDLARRRYVPNCVDLEELAQFLAHAKF